MIAIPFGCLRQRYKNHSVNKISKEEAKLAIILNEYQTPGHSLNWKIKKILHQEITPFQSLAILDLEDYGRALVLDDNIQVTIKDEFIYNEMLTHVPLFTHPNPHRVLIVGGGDGGAVREVLKHPTVDQITLCEIDEKVVQACRQYLPEISMALDDPKVEIIHKDGYEYIENNKNQYDIILIDSSDPIGPATKLFQAEFYRKIYEALKEDGVFTAQSQSPFYDQSLIKNVHNSIKSIFPVTRMYLGCTPTYPGGLWSFTLGSKVYDPYQHNTADDDVIETNYYNHDLYRAAFVLPTFLSRLLEE